MAAIINLEQVSKSYHLGETRVDALIDINLAISAGEFAAIAGPSGSGKSTLLNLCGLLDRPDSGEYRLEGRRTTELSAAQLTELRRERIGFIFQSFNLVPVISAAENIEYPLLLTGMPAAERRRTVAALVERVGLAPYAHHLPDRLSGGQRQRVAIARALIKRPALVIADEPTANLDTETATQVIDLMHEAGREQGTTFLIATHDERMVSRCHRALHLTDGVIQ